MNIGEKIKRARMEKGYTQKQFAQLLNISQQALYQYEKNLRDVPNKMLKKIADKLGKDINYFFYEEEEYLGKLDEKQRQIYKEIMELSNGERDKVLNIVKIIKALKEAEEQGTEIKKAVLDKLYERFKIPKSEAEMIQDIIFKILTMSPDKRKAMLKLIS